ncbi:Two-component response regulator SSK1p [Collariella sp. IMI 366227]|nr:Two-component response regulator SSK1p [Collariella sp. IMI 366227]
MGMGDLRSKLRAKISRRHSGIPPLPAAKHGIDSNNSAGGEPATNGNDSKKAGDETATVASQEQDASHTGTRPATRSSDRQWPDKPRLDAKQPPAVAVVDFSDPTSTAPSQPVEDGSAASNPRPDSAKYATNSTPLPSPAVPGSRDDHSLKGNDRHVPNASELAADTKTPAYSNQQPLTPISSAPVDEAKLGTSARSSLALASSIQDPGDLASSATNTPLRSSSSLTPRPPGPPRRQSLLPNRQTTLIRTLLHTSGHPDDFDVSAAEQLLPISANMVTRKLWVKRPGGSATLVTINEEDLVDDVREMILRKYGNSLGRQFDAPDLTLRIVPREGQRQERILGPEEPMARTLDAYFPGGQTVDEALLIDVPHRRTPRASPRNGPPHAQHLGSASYEEIRPLEASTDYFGPGAISHVPLTLANGAHAISVLNTGQVPQIPSPGSGTRTRQYRERPDRPRLGRQHTSSPTILNVVGAGGHPTTIAVATHDRRAPRATRSTIADPPPQADIISSPIPRSATPPPRTASPRPPPTGRLRKKKTSDAPPALPAGMLNGGVPPINVLIVEDNIINLRLLEAFVKRLKVRWQTAMNGREAVNKWRTGGFHLVLMDIQLPVMNGLDATREIRRLERMNSIGAFPTSTTPHGEPEEPPAEATEEDKLKNRELFKSPVIIVALTASSLQSDRHEALAAGCNDFLTKPVTYVWLERKVMEWGCMQALIDFDGWRQWKSYSSQKPDGEEGAVKKSKGKKNRGVPNSSSSDARSYATKTPMRVTRARRKFYDWIKNNSEAFQKPQAGQTNYVTRVLKTSDYHEVQPDMPFPNNPFFRSEPVLSDDARERIWSAVMRQGMPLKAVSAEYKVDVRRVAAVVRMKEVEKKWLAEGKPMAVPYHNAMSQMLPQAKLVQGERPFEPINDIHVHSYTMQQLFVPTSESCEFTRADAAKAFGDHILPPDDKMRIPELVELERKVAQGARFQDARREFLEATAKSEQEFAAKQKARMDSAEQRRTRVDTDRFEFRFEKINAEDVGPTGRARKAVGWRYGVPLMDRKRGQIKIPTSVE